MHKTPKKHPRSQKQVAKQKTSLRYVIAGSSIFMLMLGVFVYLNVTNKQVSKAKESTAEFTIGYNTTDAHVPVLLEVQRNDLRMAQRTTYKSVMDADRKLFDAPTNEKFTVKYAKKNEQ